MNRYQTQIIKGIALLFMIWGHLFSDQEFVRTLHTFIIIHNIPLETIICRGMGPVDFFLITGGYGLYYVYTKENDRHHISRVAKLYMHYWLILLLFIPLTILISGNVFFSPLQGLYEITGLQVSWDPPAWFLLPYSLLSLSYIRIFKILDRINWKIIFPFMFMLSFGMATSLHFWGKSTINSNPFLFIPVIFVEFLFPFFFGAYACKYKLYEKMREIIIIKKINSYYIFLSLLLLFSVRCIFSSSVIHTLYVMLFISIFVMLPIPSFKKSKHFWNILETIGNHSMNMWLIHYFILLLSGKNKLKALYLFTHRCCSRFTYPGAWFSVSNCKHYKMCLY